MYFDQKEYGKRVKNLRESKDVTQERLAEDIGISMHHLSNIERGNRVGNIDVIILLAEYFDVSLDYLLLGRIGGGTAELRTKFDTALALLEEFQKKA